jgi:hypothetical protein
MKRLLLVAAIVLAVFAASASAAPNTNCCTNPYLQFVITRLLPNQNEITLATYSVEEGYTSDQVVRQQVYLFACSTRLNNPAWVVIVYGPVDPPFTFYTNGDRIWDSRVSFVPSACSG